MEDFIQTAKNRLQDHEYKLLASGPNTEVWSCRDPKTVCYGFIISTTPMGISVTGDIGNYTFNVARDVEFLAGNDVDYYIHSKLDSIYKNNSFNKEHFLESIMDTLRNLFEYDLKFYSNIGSDYFLINIEDRHKEFNEFMKYAFTDNNIKESDFKDDLKSTLEEASQIEHIEEAYTFLRDNELLKMWDCDYDYRETDHATVQALYMINEAAKSIMKIKNKSIEKKED